MSLTEQRLQIALLQMDIAIGEPELNIKRAGQLLEEAVSGAVMPDVIVLPEMWNTGYALDRIHDLADRDGEQTSKLISAFCLKHNVNIIAGSVADTDGEDVKNRVYGFDRKGKRIADYSKIHLFRLMEEEKYLTAGEKEGTFEVEGVQAGAMICYDIRFPELSRKLALGGAKLVFVPAEWPHPRLHHWRTLLTARAIENQMYVIACNRVGVSGTTAFFGHSMIIDPWGEVIAEGGEEEAIIRASIDVSLVDEVRARIPVFEDRRPTLY
nr:carbon-nitrogen family hydrolase [Paenibacillus swuensis]